MPRESWVRFEGRTYPVPEARMVVFTDDTGLWFDLLTGGEDDDVFQSSGGLTIHDAFISGATSLADLEGRDLEYTQDGGDIQVDDGFFWELGETLEIDRMVLRVGPRQGNLCMIEVEARVLRHETDAWRPLRCVGRLATVIEDD